MSTFDEIGHETQKISERLARLDAEREKLTVQLNDLEVAERVLARFGKSGPRERRRPGRPAKTAVAAPAPPPRRPAQAAAKQAQHLSVADAVLKALHAHPEGVTAGDMLKELSREYGLTVRPNHLGIALQRHRRAGRLEQRDQRWYSQQQQEVGDGAA